MIASHALPTRVSIFVEYHLRLCIFASIAAREPEMLLKGVVASVGKSAKWTPRSPERPLRVSD
jgi:hypothetical protein